jgi:endonuclease/exonuclease/phosphatase family metal-dependent hydrolase
MRHRVLPLLTIGLMWACPDARATELRVATFNIAMGLEQPGQMSGALLGGHDPRLRQVADILQRVRPDIILLNEFDYEPNIDAAGLFNRLYLEEGCNDRPAIRYDYHFRAPVNTGIQSGLDLDGDGVTGGPGDAWGFGAFPGQYGMLVLSRYPVNAEQTRTFQEFPWSWMPGALQPETSEGYFYKDETWRQLRLSSKSHWDVVFDVEGSELHLLAAHPTPPVFDGPEDRNGRRNHDEIRFWLDYVTSGPDGYMVDDQGRGGGLAPGANFVIAGDLNADPNDGASIQSGIRQLLDSPRVNSSCVPASEGARDATRDQGGINAQHGGDPAQDTADFSDRYTGNLRVDYALPSSTLDVRQCGVFWPAYGLTGDDPGEVSDHRLVWVDFEL